VSDSAYDAVLRWLTNAAGGGSRRVICYRWDICRPLPGLRRSCVKWQVALRYSLHNTHLDGHVPQAFSVMSYGWTVAVSPLRRADHTR
jgi:hypothetical protein